jgi:Flp pilus assembly pilin Flp
MHIKNKRGQSTVEYILLVTAVVAVMIVFATSQNGGIQGQLCGILNTAANGMNSEMQALDQSHTSPTGGNGTPGYSVNVNPS